MLGRVERVECSWSYNFKHHNPRADDRSAADLADDFAGWSTHVLEGTGSGAAGLVGDLHNGSSKIAQIIKGPFLKIQDLAC